MSEAQPQSSKKPRREIEADDLVDYTKEFDGYDLSSTIQTNRRKCPYLDTINRQLLDFDMEKLCSVTLTNMNVYVCLVCGKFFQGRGKHTPAYTHSVQYGHFVFINLHDSRAFCLPDGYEVIDSSLDDVKRCLNPTFSMEEILSLDSNTSLARDVHGVAYLPGFVGLNNLKQTDYANVVLHALSHVIPVRNFFLRPENYLHSKSTLVHKFGEALRKIWSHSNFKSVVSPQEFLQEVTVASKKRFSIGQMSGQPVEGVEFLIWLLDCLHRGLNVSKKAGGTGGATIIDAAFQGFVEVTTLTKKRVKPLDWTDKEDEGEDELGASEAKQNEGGDEAGVGNGSEFFWDKSVTVSPFRCLSLDIPPTPLFKDSQGGLVIPQIPLFEVLRKFDGNTWTDQVLGGVHTRKQYRLQSLPPYLVLHLARFTRNNFYLEKNPTIVTFPVKNLELREYLLANDTPPLASSVPDMPDESLRRVLEHWGGASVAETGEVTVDGQSLASREDLEAAAKRCLEAVHATVSTKYDLIANICHDSATSQSMSVSIGVGGRAEKPKGQAANVSVLGTGQYRVHTRNKATNQWFELQDLHVTETMPQLIGLSESYILMYERKALITS